MDFIEEWLDHLELSLEDLQQRLVGSWIFDYAAALSRVGVNTLLVFVSRRVRCPTQVVHAPTGATIWLFPPPRGYARLRDALESRLLRNRWAARIVMRHLAPYIATPLWRIARVLRAANCGAIICQEYECPRFDVLVLLGRLTRAPVFPSFHGGDGRSSLEGLLHPITVRACAGVIISADAEARRAQRKYSISPAKLARIPNPIDTKVWRPQGGDEARAALKIPADALVTTWHGALYLHAKGLDLLIEAWEQVTRARPDRDMRLLIVGGGRDGACLECLIAQTHARGITFLKGWEHDRRRLRGYLSAADLYVLPSRSEGYPNALLEAMACGLPSVATDIAGVPDIVGRGESAAGVIVPPGDADALADAIGRLVDDDTLRARLAHHARERVGEQFSPHAVGARMRDFFTARGMH